MQNIKFLKVHQKTLLNKTSFFVLLIITLFGLFFTRCGDCKYTITKEYIKSTCAFKYGFMFQELKVDSFNNENLPERYEVTREISLSLIKETMKPSKKIFFYKVNKNYEWHDIKNASLHRTLPVKIQKGCWYKIRGLYFLGHPDRAVFLFIDNKGVLYKHGYRESDFW
jgi:hypothetical protein